MHASIIKYTSIKVNQLMYFSTDEKLENICVLYMAD